MKLSTGKEIPNGQIRELFALAWISEVSSDLVIENIKNGFYSKGPIELTKGEEAELRDKYEKAVIELNRVFKLQGLEPRNCKECSWRSTYSGEFLHCSHPKALKLQKPFPDCGTAWENRA